MKYTVEINENGDYQEYHFKLKRHALEFVGKCMRKNLEIVGVYKYPYRKYN